MAAPLESQQTNRVCRYRQNGRAFLSTAWSLGPVRLQSGRAWPSAPLWPPLVQ